MLALARVESLPNHDQSQMLQAREYRVHRQKEKYVIAHSCQACRQRGNRVPRNICMLWKWGTNFGPSFWLLSSYGTSVVLREA